MDDEGKLESALGDAFALDPPPPKLDIPEPAAAPEPAIPEGSAEAAPEQETALEKPAESEPEFEFEYEGKTHKLIGKETIRAELAKARDYSQKTEQIARVREALVANAQLQQAQAEFQGSIMADIAELRMIDSRLEAFMKVDWNAAIDNNFTEAMKLQEQRNQLKQLRDAKLGELNQKQQQFQQGRATAALQLLAAEGQALVAKLPEWRNSEKASTEQTQIRSSLAGYGFNQAEINSLTDHRMVLVARKAMLYDQLMANKDARVKQARDAPPMVQPGAAPATPDGRAQFAKARAKIRELGTKGNHAAQERLVTQMFERAFKLDKPA
jgi:hypothetical protein